MSLFNLYNKQNINALFYMLFSVCFLTFSPGTINLVQADTLGDLKFKINKQCQKARATRNHKDRALNQYNLKLIDYKQMSAIYNKYKAEGRACVALKEIYRRALANSGGGSGGAIGNASGSGYSYPTGSSSSKKKCPSGITIGGKCVPKTTTSRSGNPSIRPSVPSTGGGSKSGGNKGKPDNKCGEGEINMLGICSDAAISPYP